MNMQNCSNFKNLFLIDVEEHNLVYIYNNIQTIKDYKTTVKLFKNRNSLVKTYIYSTERYVGQNFSISLKKVNAPRYHCKETFIRKECIL